VPRKKTGAARTAPHARVKSAARDRAAAELDDDAAWAAGVSEQLLADCHEYQLAAALDPGRRVSLLVGRGGGKTTTMRVRALRKITSIKRARVIYAATSGPEAERLNWEPLKQLIDELGLSNEFSFNESKLRCTCKRTGGTYQLIGIDDKKEVNKWRGQPFDEVQIDEAASHVPLLLELFIDRSVGPRLGERGGCIVLGGTPGHILAGLFFDATGPGSDKHRPYAERDNPEFAGWLLWSSHAWNMVQIMALPRAAARYPALVRNWTEALVEKAAKGWSDQNPVWMREYLGLWAADVALAMYHYLARHDDGRICNMWDPLDLANGGAKLEGVAMLEACVAALPDDFDDWMFAYGMDMGSRDPMALNVIAFSPSDRARRFFHVLSFERRAMHAKLIAELLVGPEAVRIAMGGGAYTVLGGLFGITGWPVAIVADLAHLGEAVIAELAAVYGIRIEPADKSDKYSAVELTNGDLVDERAFIIAGSVLEHQMSTLQWKPNEFGQLMEDKSAPNHSADGWIYIRTKIGSMFGGLPPPEAAHKLEAAAGARDDPARPRAKPKDKPKAAPPRVMSDPEAWGEGPVSSRPRAGEFGSLLR
jgi:hypothetical protein